MCIAIYKPKNITISKETLAECFKSNQDGAGFMYVENKELKIFKGFFTFDEFYEAYKPHELKQAVIHFRIKTHGAILTENCHPFNINQSLGFVHNGIISGFGSADASDTRDFNAKILQPIVAKYGNMSLFQPALQQLIEARIGYSKLIFLDRHGNHHIFNELKGEWSDGVWYSNSSYKPYVPTYKPPALVPYKEKEPPKLYSTKLQAQGKKAFRVLKVGDLVTLTRGHWCESSQEYLGLDEIFEIVSINSNYTANVLYTNMYGVESYAQGIPFSKLDFLDEPINNEVEEATPYGLLV
jgi:hypothetical protein